MVPAGYPVGVVVAKREYEAWFLAAFPSIRFRQALTDREFRLSGSRSLVGWMSRRSPIARSASPA